MNRLLRIGLLIGLVQLNGFLTALCWCRPSQTKLHRILNQELRANRDPEVVKKFICRYHVTLDYNMLTTDEELTPADQKRDAISPLEYTIQRGQPLLAQALLECKASPTYTHTGLTPLKQAENIGNQAIISMIGKQLKLLARKQKKKPKQSAFDGYQAIELDAVVGDES